MALNNFDASIVGRSSSCKARNGIKKAAYNSRCKMEDERTGETWDYRKLGGIEWDGLFIPENGKPEWQRIKTKEERDHSRQNLYRDIERREDAGTKPDKAQIVHSWILAIPHELTKEQRARLMTDFGREVSRQGRVVDIVIHEPDAQGDHRNYHAHVLVSMRHLDPSNEYGFADKIKAPGIRRGAGNGGYQEFQRWSKEELAKWKDRYSELGARYLRRAGFEIEAERFRVGHKTIKEQYREAEKRGDWEWVRNLKDRQPTRHMGPGATAMERDKLRPVKTHLGDINHEIINRNRARQGLQPLHRHGAIPRTFKRAAAKALDIPGQLLESVLAPVLTPQQKWEGRVAEDQRRRAGDWAEERRQSEREQALRGEDRRSRDSGRDR
jgi:hypothetical protein